MILRLLQPICNKNVSLFPPVVIRAQSAKGFGKFL
jgi:hypothetical protein